MSSEAENMLPADAKLYSRLDEVIHYVWDPIGVSRLPGARDEYHSYLPGLFGRLQKDDREGLLEYMKWIVEERMALAFDAEVAAEAIDTLFEWKRSIESEI